jgi:Arrestin (or S-antigen), C-terminal domain
VIIDRPWKFDLTYKTAFTVLKQLDLNYENPALKIPTKMEVSKTFCCLFCKTAPLFLAASIPLSGYVAGQTIHVSIDANNQSNVDVESIEVSLLKIIHYNSQTPTKATKEEVITERKIRCGAMMKKKMGRFDQTIAIPTVPPSNMNYCRVLNVSYEIQVKAKVDGMHKNLELKLPITIGTVPLRFQNPQQYAPQNFPSELSHTPSPTQQYSFSDTIAAQSINQPANSDLRENLTRQ